MDDLDKFLDGVAASDSNGADFTSRFSRLNDSFQQAFGRPLTVTAGSQGFRGIHQRLYNGDARDVRSRDLSPEERQFLVDSGPDHGLDVRDYTKTWKQVGGTAPHIHINTQGARGQRSEVRGQKSDLDQFLDEVATTGQSAPADSAGDRSTIGPTDEGADFSGPHIPMDQTPFADLLKAQTRPRRVLPEPGDTLPGAATPESLPTALQAPRQAAPARRPEKEASITPRVQVRIGDLAATGALTRDSVGDRLLESLGYKADERKALKKLYTKQSKPLPWLPSEEQVATLANSGEDTVGIDVNPQAVAGLRKALKSIRALKGAVTGEGAARVQGLQQGVDSLTQELNSLAQNRQKLIAAGTSGDELAPIDRSIFQRAHERDLLAREIDSHKKGTATSVEEVQDQLAQLEGSREEHLRAGAVASTDRQRQELYSIANREHARVQMLRHYLDQEESGHIGNPLLRELASRPVKPEHIPTRWEEISGGVGAGAASVFAGMNELGANIVNSDALRRRADEYHKLGAISAEGAGPGLVPEMAKAVAAAGLAYPMFAGVAKLGAAIGGRVLGGALGTGGGEAGALGLYGAAEHAHEGPTVALKAALQNALLIPVMRAAGKVGLPTRVSITFATGFIPTYLESGDLSAATAQGLVFAGMASHGKKPEENLTVEERMVADLMKKGRDLTPEPASGAAAREPSPRFQTQPTEGGSTSDNQTTIPETVRTEGAPEATSQAGQEAQPIEAPQQVTRGQRSEVSAPEGIAKPGEPTRSQTKAPATGIESGEVDPGAHVEKFDAALQQQYQTAVEHVQRTRFATEALLEKKMDIPRERAGELLTRMESEGVILRDANGRRFVPKPTKGDALDVQETVRPATGQETAGVTQEHDAAKERSAARQELLTSPATEAPGGEAATPPPEQPLTAKEKFLEAARQKSEQRKARREASVAKLRGEPVVPNEKGAISATETRIEPQRGLAERPRTEAGTPSPENGPEVRGEEGARNRRSDRPGQEPGLEGQPQSETLKAKREEIAARIKKRLSTQEGTVRETGVEYNTRRGLPYERRPDATRKASRLAEAAVRDLDSLKGRVSDNRLSGRSADQLHSPTRVHAVGITEPLKRTGRIDLRGMRARHSLDVAQLAQVYRDPRFETFRVIYTKGDEIAAHEGVTSRLAGSSSAFLLDNYSQKKINEIHQRLRASSGAERTRLEKEIEGLGRVAINRQVLTMLGRMKRLGADGYYLLHNHPSGEPYPSFEDQRLTRDLESKLPGFRGHVIIDSGEYGFLAPDGGDVSMHKLTVPPEKLLVPSVPDSALNWLVTGADDVAIVGKRFQSKGWVPIIYRSTSGEVRAIEEIPSTLFGRTKEAADFIRGRKRKWGATMAFAFSEETGDLAPGMRLVEKGALTDHVHPSIGAREMGVKPRAVPELVPNAFRVGEGPSLDQLHPELRNDLVEIARSFIEEGKTDFNELMDSYEELLGDHFDKVEPYLPAIFDQASTKPARSAEPDRIPLAAGKPEEQAATVGKESRAVTPRGMEVQTRFAVFPAGDLVTSHNTELKPNPHFPEGVQNRDRAKVSSEDDLLEKISRFEPEYLGENIEAGKGAPIVGPDMAVESGNGRTILLRRIYRDHPEQAAKYKQFVLDQADKLGLDPAAIEKLDAPILARIRTTELTPPERIQFAEQANEETQLKLSPVEVARADARKLNSQAMSQFAPNEEGELVTPANRGFIQHFLDEIVGPNRGDVLTDDGRLNQTGIARIRNAIFARAYGDTDAGMQALEKLAESPDNNVKRVINALVYNAGRFAALKDRILSGSRFPVDISSDLGEAARQLSLLREHGGSVEDYLRQRGLFGDDLSRLQKKLLYVFNEFKHSARSINGILDRYFAGVEALGDPRQESFFAKSPPTKEELFEAALEEAIHGKDEQGGLFSQPPTTTLGGPDKEILFQSEPGIAGSAATETPARDQAPIANPPSNAGGQRPAQSQTPNQPNNVEPLKRVEEGNLAFALTRDGDVEISSHGIPINRPSKKLMLQARSALARAGTPEVQPEVRGARPTTPKLTVNEPPRVSPGLESGTATAQTELPLEPAKPGPDIAPPKATRMAISDEGLGSPAFARKSLTRKAMPTGAAGQVEDFKVSQRAREILADLGVPAAEKYLSPRLAGIYKLRSKNIRVQSFFDVFTVAHEGSHFISDQHGLIKQVIHDTGGFGPFKSHPTRKDLTSIYEQYYPVGKRSHSLHVRMEEGFATLVENYLYDPATITAQYPRLVDDFIRPGGRYYEAATSRLLDKMNSLVEDYAKMSPHQRIGARIVSGPEVVKQDKGFDLAQRAIYEAVNQFEPLKRAGQTAGVEGTLSDPFIHAYTQMGRGSVIHSWIKGKNTLVLDRDGNWQQEPGTVKDYLKLIKGQEKEFDTLLVARRVVADHNRLVDRQQQLGKLNPGDPGYDELLADSTELARTLKNDDFSLQDAAAVVNQYEPGFKPALEVYDRINKRLVSFAENTGLITSGYAAELRASDGYSSWIRSVNDELRGSAGQGGKSAQTKARSFKGRSGATLDIISPTYNQVTAIGEIIGKGLDNMIWRSVYDLAQHNTEIARRFEKMPTETAVSPDGKISFPQDRDPNLLKVWVNGKRAYIKAAPEFLEVAKNLRGKEWDLFATLIRMPSAVFTRLTTSANPFFALGNITIDQFSAAMNTKTGFKPVVDPLHSFAEFLREVRVTKEGIGLSGTGQFEKYLELGGKRQVFASQYEVAPEQTIASILGRKSKAQRVGHVLDLGLSALELPSNLSEYLTRFAEFKRAKEMGKSDVEAMAMASEVTTPFQLRGHMGGSFGQVWRDSLPYFNAGLQVLYKLGRATHDNPARVATVASGLLAAALTSAIATFKSADEEQRRELANLPARELGKAIFIPSPLGKSLIRIKIPGEVGALTGLAYLYVAQHYNQNKVKFSDVLDSLSTALPNQLDVLQPEKLPIAILPQAVSPTVQALTNKKIYPELLPIVPDSLKDKPVEMQYTAYTSKVGKAIGAALGIAPAKIDFWVKNQLGAVGGMLLGKMPQNPLGRQEEGFQMAGRAYNNFYSQRQLLDQQFQRLSAPNNSFSPEEQERIIRTRALYDDVAVTLTKMRKVLVAKGDLPEALKQQAFEALVSIDAGEPIEKLAPKIDELTTAAARLEEPEASASGRHQLLSERVKALIATDTYKGLSRDEKREAMKQVIAGARSEATSQQKTEREPAPVDVATFNSELDIERGRLIFALAGDPQYKALKGYQKDFVRKKLAAALARLRVKDPEQVDGAREALGEMRGEFSSFVRDLVESAKEVEKLSAER